MTDTKILVIDDDPEYTEQAKTLLGNEGYAVKIASNGLDGMEFFRMFEPDLVLLEVLLPQKDGWQLCREIREQSQTPIIITSTRGEVFDKVLGLELGADDYMVKPIDPKELSARIKAVLRRTRLSAQPGSSDVVKFDNMEVSLQKFELRLGGKAIDVPPKELELLYFLASNSNRVYTRDQLLDKVWGFDYLGDSRTVDVHVKRLREKLQGASDKWSLKTVWGVGYKFEVIG
ncbi:MAG: response regulator transcription factor [Clostridia bacterium]|nr:response regulator transcription factor [Clostridia bacterium]